MNKGVEKYTSKGIFFNPKSDNKSSEKGYQLLKLNANILKVIK